MNAGNAQLLPPPALARRVGRLQHEFRKLLQKSRLTDEEIHALRVGIKKLRAWLRVSRDAWDDWRAVDADLRKVAHTFGPARDRHVMRQTMCDVIDQPQAPRHEALLRALVPGRPRRPAIASALQRKCMVIDFVTPAAITPAKLRKRLTKSHAKARRTRKKDIYDASCVHELHDLRKRVKRLGQQLELVVARSELSPLRRGLRRLASELGDAHDLDVLLERLDQLAEPKVLDAYPDLRERIAMKRKAHATAACGLARKWVDADSAHILRKLAQGTSV